jgi:hypothetical protein
MPTATKLVADVFHWLKSAQCPRLPWRRSGPAAKQGKSVVTQQIDTIVEKATLNPKYGIDFFREVRIAEGLDRAK